MAKRGRGRPKGSLNKKTLEKLDQSSNGIKKEDIQIVDAPDNPEVGQVVVEIWPHELVIARIRTVRGESFISGTELNIELKTDETGKYID